MLKLCLNVHSSLVGTLTLMSTYEHHNCMRTKSAYFSYNASKQRAHSYGCGCTCVARREVPVERVVREVPLPATDKHDSSSDDSWDSEDGDGLLAPPHVSVSFFHASHVSAFFTPVLCQSVFPPIHNCTRDCTSCNPGMATTFRVGFLRVVPACLSINTIKPKLALSRTPGTLYVHLGEFCGVFAEHGKQKC